MSEPIVPLISCEHASNTVPDQYAHLFASPEARQLLASHRGWDIGALPIAVDLSQRLCAPLHSTVVTRLLIEANRSLEAHDLFSTITRVLSEQERRAIIDRYYVPYRTSLERTIAALIGSGHRVLHLSIHSCTDELNGETRELELGLLFDPSRTLESRVCHRLREILSGEHPQYRVLHNRPYLGTDDGLTTELRKQFPDAAYAGVELEFRQGHIADPARAAAIARATAQATARVLDFLRSAQPRAAGFRTPTKFRE